MTCSLLGHRRLASALAGLTSMAPRGRELAGQRLAAPFCELAGHKQAAVGDAGAGVGEVDQAAHLGLECVADVVKRLARAP